MSLGTTAAGISLREARAQDVTRIQAVYAHHVRFGLGSFEEEPPESDDLERRRAAIEGAGLPYLVAERTGPAGPILAGYAYAGIYRPRSGYQFTVEDSVYVAPDAQGRGVGRALLAALIDRAAALGMRQMIAMIGDSGNIASIGLHRALGFREVGTFRAIGFKHGKWIDSVLMQRGLGYAEGTPPDRPGTRPSQSG